MLDPVAVGDGGRDRRRDQRRREESATARPLPAHAARWASAASGSSSTASEPCSERRRSEAAAVRGGDLAHHRQAVPVPAPPGEPGDHLGRVFAPGVRAGGAAGVGDRDAQPPVPAARLDDDRGAAVLDRVDDQVVERLREPGALARDDRPARSPAQLQRASAHRRPRLPAPDRGLEQRLEAHRAANRGRRPAVDLAVEPLQRRRRQLHRASTPWAASTARARGRQGDRLQRPAQLVERLVQGVAPPPGAQPLRGQDDGHRGGQRPAGRDVRQVHHPSTSL